MSRAEDFLNDQYGATTEEAIYDRKEAIEIFESVRNDRDLDYLELFNAAEFLAGHDVSIKIDGKEISFTKIMQQFHKSDMERDK